MEKEKIYNMPYVGCILGSAFQRLSSQLEASLKESKLPITAAEYMILRALYSRDGLQQCEIVDMVGKDKSAICRSVSSLSKKGLVSTEPVSYKCIRVWLTKKGRDIEPQIMKIAQERHAALEQIASSSDIETMMRVLNAIISSDN